MLLKVPLFLSLVSIPVALTYTPPTTAHEEFCDTTVGGAECDFVTGENTCSNDAKQDCSKNFPAAATKPSRSKWDRIDDLLKSQTRGFLEAFEGVAKRANVSDVCEAGVETFFSSLSDLDAWALKMLGASGRLDLSDLFSGRFSSLGDYDECLRIRADRSRGEIRGQYCMVQYTALPPQRHLEDGETPPKWVQDYLQRTGPYLQETVFFLGTCVPSTCSDQELTQIITQIVAPFGVSAEVVDCQVTEPIVWTWSLVAAVCFLGGIALLCILGTAADIMSTNRAPEKNPKKSNPSRVAPFLKMFSVPSNVGLLMEDGGGSFRCLDGIRVLMSSWVVLHHTYCTPYLLDFRKFRNGLEYEKDFSGSEVKFAAIDNAMPSVASFFFLSGFLMLHKMWRDLEKGRKVNFFDFFLHKYWRMTPCVVLTLAVFVVLVDTGGGPLWPTEMGGQMEACRANWWTNLLYVGNWWGASDMCMIQTWFVSCLMQLSVVGFILIHVTFRWPTAGVFAGAATVLGCGALVVTIAVLKALPLPTSLAQLELDNWGVSGWSAWFRFKPFYYMQSYAIGMLVGYLVLKYKDVKIKRIHRVVGWTLSLIGSSYAVFGAYGPKDSAAYRAAFYGSSFAVWSLSLGWLVYACAAGYGGVLDSVLSWRGFRLLSSLTYLTYLLHVPIMYGDIAATRDTVHYSHYGMFCSFLSNMAFSTILSFIGHVTFEMPLGHLEKVIL